MVEKRITKEDFDEMWKMVRLFMLSRMDETIKEIKEKIEYDVRGES